MKFSLTYIILIIIIIGIIIYFLLKNKNEKEKTIKSLFNQSLEKYEPTQNFFNESNEVDEKSNKQRELSRNIFNESKNKSIILKEIIPSQTNEEYTSEDFKKEVLMQNEFYKLQLAPKLYDYFECDGKFYLVMEPYDETLYNYFFENNTANLSLLQMLSLLNNVINQVNQKIKIANNKGLTHGDLHRNNVMFKVDPETKKISEIVLIDFGRSNKTEILPLKYNEKLIHIDRSLSTLFKYLYYYLFNNEQIINSKKDKLNNRENTNSFLIELIKYVFINNDQLTDKDKEMASYIIEDLEDKERPLKSPVHFVLRQLINTSNDFYKNVDQFIGIIQRLLQFYNLDDFDYNLIKDISKKDEDEDFDLEDELKFKYKFEKFRYDEYFGFIKDCGERIKRFISDIDITTKCDWTKIGDKPLGKGLYGATYKVNCDKL